MAAGRRNPRRQGARGQRAARTGAAGSNSWLWIVGALSLIVAVWVIASGGSKQTQAKKQAPPSVAQAVKLATKFDARYQNVESGNRVDAEDELGAMVTDDFRDALYAKLEKLYNKIEELPLAGAAGDEDVIARSQPLTHSEKKVGDQVVVTIWGVTLAGINGSVTPRSSWTRDQLTMVLVDGKWKVAKFEELTPLVPLALAQDKPTAEYDFWRGMKGAQFYEAQ